MSAKQLRAVEYAAAAALENGILFMAVGDAIVVLARGNSARGRGAANFRFNVRCVRGENFPRNDDILYSGNTAGGNSAALVFWTPAAAGMPRRRKTGLI